MTIEKLTDIQRTWLTRYKSRGPGVLRLIDAQAAEIERLRAVNEGVWARYRMAIDAWVRWDDLARVLANQPAAPAIYHSRPGSDVFVLDQPAAPECPNTEAFLSGDNTGCDGTNCPVHLQPAAPARTEMRNQPEAPDVRAVRISAGGMNTPQRFTMQAQPASAARTDAEQAVLDACAAMTLCDDDPDADPSEPQELGEDCYIYTDDQYRIARAELARRGVK